MAEKDMSYRVENPATGEVITTFPTATDDEIQEVLAASEKGFKEWSALDIAERKKYVLRIAELFDERQDELVEIIGREMGKSRPHAIDEVELSANIFRYYANNGEEFAADRKIESFNGGTAVIRHLPLGALVGIMPWNFPYYQVARFAAPNLMNGNSIILKHAEICPESSAAIQKIIEDAGVPAGVYQNVYASHDQITTMIEDPRVQGVSLTGSERAGAAVGATAGKNLKKAVLELGGNDPYVLLDTDDVKAAAELAWETRIYNMGQVCNGNKRMIVMDDIYDEFVDELVKLAEQAKPGTPEEAGENGIYSPLSSRDAAERLDEQVSRAVKEGATLRAGGGLGDNAYYAPAVITDLGKDNSVYSEELFGPIALVFKVSSDEEALELANDTQYGLGGAVFSQDTERARAIARQINSGMANVNTPAGEGEEIPFGGVKRSGFGRELGPLGMDEFVNKQLYFEED